MHEAKELRVSSASSLTLLFLVLLNHNDVLNWGF